MKRYKPHGPINEITKLSECMMIEEPEGEWVRWEDVEGLECNCAEKSSGWPLPDHWICPAHGYKKR